MLSGSGDLCVSVSGALTDIGSVLMKTEEVIVSAKMMQAMSDSMFFPNYDYRRTHCGKCLDSMCV